MTTTKSTTKKRETKGEVVARIARDTLFFETLVEQRSGADFKEVASWSVKMALEAAYEAGRASNSRSKQR